MVFGRRGQGGMEYMGSYGWAVLVVIVVGIAMYSFGILNWNPVASPTSSGFMELMPFLPTAQIRDHVWNDGAADYNGFMVQFVNAGGAAVRITDIIAEVNSGTCDFQEVLIEPNVVVMPQSIFGPNNCFTVTGGVWALCTSVQDSMVSKDESFRVLTMTQDGAGGVTPCEHISVSGKYEVELQIGYGLSVGDMGVNTADKYSSGKIILSGTSK